jgi:hypothetical protein
MGFKFLIFVNWRVPGLVLECAAGFGGILGGRLVRYRLGDDSIGKTASSTPNMGIGESAGCDFITPLSATRKNREMPRNFCHR